MSILGDHTERIIEALSRPAGYDESRASEVMPTVKAILGSVEVELGDFGKLRLSPKGADSLGAALINAAAEARKQ